MPDQTPSRFLAELARRTLVFDGAMGTSIYSKSLSVEHDYCGCENCTDILVRTRPDVIQEIHESFLAAGADVVETDTFGANKLVLSEFDLTSETFSLNKQAAEIARAACAKFATSDKPRFVAGSIGPGTKLLTLGNTTWDVMLDSYREQARGLIAGGADVLIIETCQDLQQVKCAINAVLQAIHEAGRTPAQIPIMASVTIETTGTMLVGTAIEAAATALAGYPIISLGLNCATGPTEMADHIHWLGRNWSVAGGSAHAQPRLPRYISCIPNAGLPVLVDGRTEYPLRPEPFVEAVSKFIERDGVRIVGGCCGTTPEHIRQLARRVEQINRDRAREHAPPLPPGPLGPDAASRDASPSDGACTSLYSRTEYRQDNSILIVGERMNASGSKKFKQLLEAEDWDGIVSLAREQVKHDGAHVLDLNVDYAGRDNARDAAEVVKRVVRQVDVPLMIDSTQVGTIEAALKHAPGKCIINSANFEDGNEKFDHICGLARTYGAALVIGSIDEDKEASMARTASRKLAIAARGFERATGVHALAPEDLFFDPLVLPISTGMESDRRSGLETIEGVRLIAREFPRCQTVVGLSNVSFGLKPAARVALNSAFLHELQEAGLTSAIVHFSKILPRNKIADDVWHAALDLIYDRREAPGGPKDPLQAFIALFKDVEGSGAAKKEKKVLTLEEQLRAHIIDGEKEGLRESLDAAMRRYKPLDIINDHLLDGMKTVGELFGSGQMQLPFVLQSAEVMKMAVSHLEPHMQRVQGTSKGTIVLATVKGDVHDIGKNLVDIILTNNGYTVHNLGIKQPIADIIKAWKEHQADAIGMSGLLVKSVNVMEENLKEMNAASLDRLPPVVLGGAALSRHYCESTLRQTYEGDVFYGKDAFVGLRVMDHIMGGATATLNREIDDRQGKRSKAEELIVKARRERASAPPRRIDEAGAPAPAAGSSATRLAERARSDVAHGAPVPTPPFWGSRVVTGIDLDHVYPFINPVALFRGQWQVKKGALSDAAYDALIHEQITPVFDRLKHECKREKILQPAVVYGYFPCGADGDDLVIFDPDSITEAAGPGAAPQAPASLREIERFTFPRQPDKRRLCISDFFRPIESGEHDVIAMHCVTMGPRATEVARDLFARNDYTQYLYLHGLGVETAEALAEFWHKRIRQELGIASEDSPRVRELFTQHYRGSRYSFGYPACPDMSDQQKLWRLLKPERIGCTLTENWQIDPEQSTSAIIVHHPEAKYFNV
ncbi:MAG: methionine synthase [Phycisphaerales bacterium]